MKLGKRVVGTVLLVCFAFAPYEASAQKAIPPDLCNTSWFRDQAAAASREDKSFLLMTDTLFKQGEYTYVVAVRVPRSVHASSVTLTIFAKKRRDATYRKIHEAEIPNLVGILTMMMKEKSPNCLFPHYRPWFDASVVDLDGDGRFELIVQSNRVGTCSSCLSEVRVYEIQDEIVGKELEEMYSDIRFGEGEGLMLRSFQRGLNDLIPIKKYFFVIPGE